MTINNPTAAELSIAIRSLQRTKSVLAQDSWSQRRLYEDTPGPRSGRCLLGAWVRADNAVCAEALSEAANDNGSPLSLDEVSAGSAIASMTLRNLVPYGMVIMWNDVVGRTVDEVYQLLDKAIEGLNYVREHECSQVEQVGSES